MEDSFYDEYVYESEYEGRIVKSVADNAIRVGREIATIMTNNTRLGPEPFAFSKHSGESVWVSPKFAVSIVEADGDPKLMINFDEDYEGDMTMRDLAEVVKQTLANPPLQGARRRRRATKKVSKKRKTTRRR